MDTGLAALEDELAELEAAEVALRDRIEALRRAIAAIQTRLAAPPDTGAVDAA